MKSAQLTISKKVLLLLLISSAAAILFSFFFLHYLYKELYLNTVKESVIYQGERTASHYHYGTLSDEIIEKIHWYNVVSQYEVVVIDNLDDLSSYFPYKINYESLLGEEDRRALEAGKYVIKDGYVKEFDREIVGAVFPVSNGESMIGFIYVYVPLADLLEVFKGIIPILVIAGTFTFLLLFFILNSMTQTLFRPLEEIQRLSNEVANGNFSSRVLLYREDEIGQLAKSFNEMSSSLEKQEEYKREFLANVVHEMRTPLTYIGGYAEVLKKEMHASSADADRYLQTIGNETHRLSKLLNDLILLDQMQDSLYQLHRAPLSAAQLLYDTMNVFTLQITQKNLAVVSEIDENLIVFADEKRMQQVYYNLLDNGIKYAADGTEIRVNLRAEGNNMHFSITNAGTTISPEDLHKIGERFFRTDKARNRSTGGTGLGLSIVKEIVRLHGGRFTVNSSKESGTTASISLPLHALED
ncbi:HAMP domain-containing protein [Bacillus lacus]|uniref:histidine kinase n=1 Tax=Metabacillus lacus TaxID=1983721 RepID=A0A7X2IYA1_9BACI|nr:HAMP domain-containing sensor histidine kinase [Metabacillus lacus]MRX71879.1 HAMP domain-containing protein [Metabacillus lacus]